MIVLKVLLLFAALWVSVLCTTALSCCQDYSQCSTSSERCPCKNGGVCKVTSSGIECDCAAGYSGITCEIKYLTEDRFVDLQKKVSSLVAKQSATDQELKQLKEQVANIEAAKWRLHRTRQVFPKLEKLILHQVTPTFDQKIPITLPNNTRAILISIYCHFWNSDGHAYLFYETHQKGNNNPEGKVFGDNTHFRVYANTFYYEQMVPWSSKLPSNLIFKVTSAYQTGGALNWYRVRLVGYITSN